MYICKIKEQHLDTGKENTVIQFVGEGDLLTEAKKRAKEYFIDGDLLVFKKVGDNSFALSLSGSSWPKDIITISIHKIEVFNG